jgi:hypothetical protein
MVDLKSAGSGADEHKNKQTGECNADEFQPGRHAFPFIVYRRRGAHRRPDALAAVIVCRRFIRAVPDEFGLPPLTRPPRARRPRILFDTHDCLAAVPAFVAPANFLWFLAENPADSEAEQGPKCAINKP